MEDSEKPHLKRVLGLGDLIFYGVVLIQPIAAVGLFGIASEVSNGHMVTTLLIAMVGMSMTAVSYGRMAALYPSAGSAYSYVGKTLNARLGLLAGWVMFLDYLIIPVINTIYGALTLQRLIPGVSYLAWVVLFVVLISVLNLRGIRTMARSNEIMLGIMMLVIGVFIVLAIRYIFCRDGWPGLLSTKPFYDPKTFHFPAIMTATSFAALTYIGFDGVTTLAEEVKNPKKNLLLAPLILCLFTGLFSGLQIYLAQQVWPDFHSFPNAETAFFDVSKRVGGAVLFNSMAMVLLIASIGSGLAGQAGAARLLFSMGRDGVLPGKWFSYLGPKSGSPTFNIIIMAGLTIAISAFLSYQRAAELLNFGAFLAFMGVNVAAFRQFLFRRPAGEKVNYLLDGLVPFLGFFVCLAIWLSLPTPSKIVGGIWLALGIAYVYGRKRPGPI